MTQECIFHLEAKHITFSHRRRPVLNDASLEIRPGEIISLLGSNGAGKTTLLRLLLGFLKPRGGNIFLNGKPLSTFSRRHLARHLGYVPQAHVATFPYLVRDVVLLGCWPENGFALRPRNIDIDATLRTLERLGIHHLADRPYTEISGGERQLVLIARALMQGAKILIMDEPLSGLDYGHQVRLIKLLQSLAEEGRSVLMSTHHPDHAMWGSTRVALLIDGRIEADGPPAEVLDQAAMQRLYSVDVVSLRAPDGRVVFLPARHDGT